MMPERFDFMRRLWTSPFLVAISSAGLMILAGFLFVFGPGNLSGRWIAVAAVSMALVAALRIRALERSAETDQGRLTSQLATLVEQNDRYRSTVDALADGLDVALFVCDSKANIEYANRRAIAFFQAESCRGKSLLAVSLNPELEQLVKSAVINELPQSAELSFRHPVERIGQAKAWRAPGDQVFVSVYEITELRRLERIRQDFVANVSHEMRTPMTVIRNMAETMLDGDDAVLRDKYLPKIISEVDRLSTISQDLLILSAAESNPVRKQDCDIVDVLTNVIWQLTPKAADKGLKIGYRGPEAFMIEANPAQMIQVALNLIDNAINYTSEGHISINVKENPETIEISVQDTGMGIPSEHLPRIFERFYRVDKARSRASGGTGLGLSIVKHIIEAHGGKLSVQSAQNEGSTFIVVLPIGHPSVS
ncbi:BaeS Signal transduction histidine kinase [Fimbriimonadaceae bacterium]